MQIPILRRSGGESQSAIPVGYSFSSNSDLVTEDGQNWHIRFLNSGVFRSPINMKIDLYLQGGGGAGSGSGANSSGGFGGGDGWLENHYGISLTAGTEYEIVIGAGGKGTRANGGDGGSTSAFGYTVNGGKGGIKDNAPGEGYSGVGGTRGYGINSSGGDGSSNETYAFDASSGLIFGGCGGGGGALYGGAGSGGYPYGADGDCSAEPNTGAGGGGASHQDGQNADGSYGAISGSGGSGIVIIRNAR